MKIALVHEFLNQLGGAERVLQNFLEIWPDATLHVILYDSEKTQGLFDRICKRVSFLDKLPLAHRYPKFFLPLMPKAIESFKFDDFDVVLSDSSSFAKGALARGKLHICYCHTPTRFLWTESEDYIRSQPYPQIFKQAARSFLPRIRQWDLLASQRPDFMIANSQNVQARIQKYYHREAEVIPVPVDTKLFYPQGNKENYFLIASRLEPYKKVGLVVEAFNSLGLPLKVIGRGTELVRLRAMAKPNIEFLGRLSDEAMRQAYSGAAAFIFPAEEDAGITILEAQAAGTPVIAFRKGGALETIQAGITGEFFDEQTAGSLQTAVQNFQTAKYDPSVIRRHAEQYDKEIFKEKIRNFVEEKYQNWPGRGNK